MRRLVACLLLLVATTFLALSAQDHCDDGHAHHNRAPHVFCQDDCASALVPETPQAPPADPLPRASYVESVNRPVLSMDLEPETEPPRA